MKKKIKITFYAVGIIAFISAAKYMLNKNKKVQHIRKAKNEVQNNRVENIVPEVEDKNKVFSKRKYILLKQYTKEDFE